MTDAEVWARVQQLVAARLRELPGEIQERIAADEHPATMMEPTEDGPRFWVQLSTGIAIQLGVLDLSALD